MEEKQETVHLGKWMHERREEENKRWKQRITKQMDVKEGGGKVVIGLHVRGQPA